MHQCLQRLFLDMQPIIACVDAHQGFCMVLLTGALALCAVISCILSCASIRTIQKNEIERARPVVVLEVIQDIPFYGIRMRNTGLTAARDITLQMEPKLERCFVGVKDRAIGFLSGKVEFLGPNASFQSIIGYSLQGIEKANKSLLYRGVVRYFDVEKRRYEEPVTLDFSLYKGTGYPHKKTLSDIVTELETIRRSIEHLGSASHVLQVISQPLHEYREEEQQKMEDWKRRKQSEEIQESNGVCLHDGTAKTP